jgi:hypothetical protein
VFCRFAFTRSPQGMLNELFVGRWKMLRSNLHLLSLRLPPLNYLCSYTFNFLKDTGALADRFHWFTKERWGFIKLIHVATPRTPTLLHHLIYYKHALSHEFQLTGKKPWQCLADHLCNVPGRQSAIIWDFWWRKMEEACAVLPKISCDFL